MQRSLLAALILLGAAVSYPVSDAAGATADDALLSIGNPAITLMNAWDVFDSVVDVLKTASDNI